MDPQQSLNKRRAVGQPFLEFTPALIPGLNDFFEANCLAGYLLTNGPAQKPLLVEHTNLGHVTGFVPDCDILADVGCQR